MDWVLCMNVSLTFYYGKCQMFRSGHNSVVAAAYL